MLKSFVSSLTFKAFTLLLTCYSQVINAQQTPLVLPVLAFEYPPYVTRDLPKAGLSFQYLETLFGADRFQIKPVILSMPRLQLALKQPDWCVSLMPAPTADHIYVFDIIGRKIEHRLYRLRQSEPFSWEDISELKGLTIAVFRSRKFNALRQLFKKAGLKSVLINSAEQGAQLLIYQRVDLIFSDNNSIDYLMNKMQLDRQLVQGSENIIVHRQSKLWINLNCPSAEVLLKQLTEKK